MRKDAEIQSTPASDTEVGFSSTADVRSPEPAMKAGQAGAAPGQAKETAEEVVGSAQQMAKNAAESRLGAGKEQAVDRLSGVAHGLRSSSDQFGDQETVRRLVTRAADGVENFANHLRNRDVPQLLDEVEDFARRQPAAFLGGAFAVGLIGARFLKSSRENLEEGEGRGRWRGERFSGREREGEGAVSRPGAPGYERSTERMS